MASINYFNCGIMSATGIYYRKMNFDSNNYWLITDILRLVKSQTAFRNETDGFTDFFPVGGDAGDIQTRPTKYKFGVFYSSNSSSFMNLFILPRPVSKLEQLPYLKVSNAVIDDTALLRPAAFSIPLTNYNSHVTSTFRLQGTSRKYSLPSATRHHYRKKLRKLQLAFTICTTWVFRIIIQY